MKNLPKEQDFARSKPDGSRKALAGQESTRVSAMATSLATEP